MTFGLVVFGLAVLVTLLTSLFKHVEWSAQTKNVLATVLAVVAAAVSVWVGSGGEFNDAGDVFQLAVSIYGVSQLVYHFILSGIAPGVEAKLAETKVL